MPDEQQPDVNDLAQVLVYLASALGAVADARSKAVVKTILNLQGERRSPAQAHLLKRLANTFSEGKVTIE